MISDDQLKRILSICEWHDELNRAYAVSEKLLEQMATETPPTPRRKAQGRGSPCKVVERGAEVGTVEGDRSGWRSVPVRNQAHTL